MNTQMYLNTKLLLHTFKGSMHASREKGSDVDKSVDIFCKTLYTVIVCMVRTIGQKIQKYNQRFRQQDNKGKL